MERASRETWAKRVERWKDSGLTAREFAREMGVNARTLRYWKWKLGKEGWWRDRRSNGKAGTSLARSSRKPAAPRFVEVDAAVVAGADRLELAVGQRYVVRIPDGFDGETLRRVLDVVEPRS